MLSLQGKAAGQKQTWDLQSVREVNKDHRHVSGLMLSTRDRAGKRQLSAALLELAILWENGH